MVDLNKELSELIILTASRTLMGEGCAGVAPFQALCIRAMLL